ncbi:MAG: Uma2 family endonuclease [Acidobacteria bacterium]|nr:Uma2 family endonuclease [Acidobacteriota bacterium]
MLATATQPVGRVVLRDISWDFYQSLLGEIGDAPGTRITYDNGLLQIMVISAAHDNPNRTLASIVEIVAEETETDVCHLGSTTIQRPDLLKGFEPDSCFYFTNADSVRNKNALELPRDPAPQLVIEVDVTASSLNRFSIFAAVGVAELWHYADDKAEIYVLKNGEYEKAANSLFLPVLTPGALTEFTNSYRRKMWPVWTRELREWVRTQ